MFNVFYGGSPNNITAHDQDGMWSGINAGAAKVAVSEADALLQELEKTK